MKLAAVTIDCPDPDALAEFYTRATGFERSPDSDPEYIELTGPNGVSLGFERVADYRPPQWPGQQTPQQCHLDFAVPNLDEGEARLLTLGATRAEVQPAPDRWRVLIDPAGHPFCLVIGGA